MPKFIKVKTFNTTNKGKPLLGYIAIDKIEIVTPNINHNMDGVEIIEGQAIIGFTGDNESYIEVNHSMEDIMSLIAARRVLA